MEQLLLNIARGLVDDKDAVKVTKGEPTEEGELVYIITVAPEDMGRVIGKQGKTAKAIRVVARAAGAKNGDKVRVEIG